MHSAASADGRGRCFCHSIPVFVCVCALISQERRRHDTIAGGHHMMTLSTAKEQFAVHVFSRHDKQHSCFCVSLRRFPAMRHGVSLLSCAWIIFASSQVVPLRAPPPPHCMHLHDSSLFAMRWLLPHATHRLTSKEQFLGRVFSQCDKQHCRFRVQPIRLILLHCAWIVTSSLRRSTVTQFESNCIV